MACKVKLLLSLLLYFPLAKCSPYLVERTDEVPGGFCISSANETLGPVYALDSIKETNVSRLGWVGKWNLSSTSRFVYKTVLSSEWIWDHRWHDLPMIAANEKSMENGFATISPEQHNKSLKMSILADSAKITIAFKTSQYATGWEFIKICIDCLYDVKKKKAFRLSQYFCDQYNCYHSPYLDASNITFLEDGKKWVHLQIDLLVEPMGTTKLMVSNFATETKNTTWIELPKKYVSVFGARSLFVQSGSWKPGIFKLHSERILQSDYSASSGIGSLTRVIKRPFGGNICFDITWFTPYTSASYEIEEMSSGTSTSYHLEKNAQFPITKVYKENVTPGDYEFSIHIPDMSVNFGIKRIKECGQKVSITPADLGTLIGCQTIPLENETVKLTKSSCNNIDDGRENIKLCEPLQTELTVNCSLLKFCSVSKAQNNQESTTAITSMTSLVIPSADLTRKCWYLDYLHIFKGAVFITYTVAVLLSIFLIFECKAYRQMLKDETNDEQECVANGAPIAGTSESRL